MLISKHLVACGVAALCLVSIPARGQDSPEEARLREVLREKMGEAKAAEAVAPAPSTAPEPTPVVVAPAPTTTAPAPVVAAPAPVVATPAPVVAEPTLAPVTVPTVAVPQVSAPVAPVAPVAPETRAVIPVPGDDVQAARLRNVLRERMGLTAEAAPIVATLPSASTEPPVLSNSAVLSSSTMVVASPTPVAPEPPPVLPISGSKAEQLAALLQQYKADQISPQQYHEARAKILSE